MTRTSPKLLNALRRSWLFTLFWGLLPLGMLTVFALATNSQFITLDEENWLLKLLPFVPALIAFLIGWLQWPAQRARNRALPVLHRLQMSDRPDPVPVGQFLRIDEQPPIESLPPFLQSLVVNWGGPVPRLISVLIDVLFLLAIGSLVFISTITDPLGRLSQWLNRPLPLTYWPVFFTLMGVVVLIGRWLSLRRMHDHYVTTARETGRHPFPSTR
ncbi:hypothetical protein [Brevundimonas nasdae]|uniref:Uncharacterized protein n=1 Tax=Brevundimonas nasdae TaxID=172043 RepID=A0ABX8TCZ9_9CAUL|nr:hypothetical protein [Brevundimonas nasdae]QYC09051.1 hypothetical protein KWG56_10430 [Brevundimonas nasdae]QYC15101.1 hypothetical protein KWG63_05765 [Brevundimonas nasdae]